MTQDPHDYNYEMEMAGLYAGGVLGSLFFGSLGDLLRSEFHSMGWYAIGAVAGAAGGAIAGFIFRKVALQEDQESVEPSP